MSNQNRAIAQFAIDEIKALIEMLRINPNYVFAVSLLSEAAVELAMESTADDAGEIARLQALATLRGTVN